MTFFITKITPSKITIRARAESPGGFLGDGFFDTRPGESFFELSFEELTALGVGEHFHNGDMV